jgi:hypothetical protein
VCISLSNIHILPLEPVNVVVWGDNNMHILPVEPVNVVVWGDNNIHILPIENDRFYW